MFFLHTIIVCWSPWEKPLKPLIPEDTFPGWWFQICWSPWYQAGFDRQRCPPVLPAVVPAMWCPIVTQTWLIFMYYGWMVKGLCWNLVLALWVAKVHRLVSKRFQPKKGEQLTLQYLGVQLMLHQTLQEQGIVGKATTLSCTSVPTDLYAAYCFIQRQGSPVPEGEFVLQGLT